MARKKSSKAPRAPRRPGNSASGRPGWVDGLLQRAAGSYQAGNLVEAEDLLRKVLAKAPNQCAALHYLGLVRRERGFTDEAIELLSRVAELDPRDAVARNNLGNLLRERGRIDEAVGAYEGALRIDPDYLNARFHLGLCFQMLGAYPKAEACFDALTAAAPGDAEAWHGLGICLQRRGALDDAITTFERALSLRADMAETHNALGAVFKERGDYGRAETCFQTAVRLSPQSDVALSNLAEALRLGDKMSDAADAYSRVAAMKPNDADAQYNLGLALTELGRTGAAIKAWNKCIEICPGSADAHCGLGRALMLDGRLDDAIAAYHDAIRLQPDFASAFHNLGVAYADRGDFDDARDCYREALVLDPNLANACLGLVTSRRYGPGDEDEIRGMASLLDADLDEDARIDLLFALGKALDDCGDYAGAFRHYASANRLQRQKIRFDIAAHRDRISRIIDVFSDEFFDARKDFGASSNLPILIVGMPRSGTTLVEQILASHSRVFGAGELAFISELESELPRRLESELEFPQCVTGMDRPASKVIAREYLDFLRAVAGGPVEHVTDKLPHNFLYLGLVGAILPRVKIVHCRRDPMDVCLSIFFQRFGVRHDYAYDLEEIAQCYLEYERLMRHWQRVLPNPILEISYEQLIADSEPASRALVSFCDLPWEAACLEFYKSERAVQTASNWQVRQPLYTRSVQRWQRYEQHLEEVQRILKYSGNDN